MRAPKSLAAFSSWSPLRGASIVLLLAFCASNALAQADDDPPSRVARLSDASGPAFIAPDGPNADWQPMGLNYPVTVGDNVWSGHDARVEIDFGAGHVRLSRETNIHFSQLDDRQFSAYLASGRAILKLRVLEPGESAKFDTANAQVDLLRPGSYRIETDADGLGSTLIVREGEAQLRTAEANITVFSGQTATINGNGPGSSVVVRDAVGTDGFDAWSGDRDRRFEGGSISAQYVSSVLPGVRDLDVYGTWQNTPTYGAVWYPTVVGSDWVPYRDGSWTYVRPWGWTWVDNAPWGWAPFHYGRWVQIGPRWAWCPGEYVRRPVYAPALVAWYGGASGTSWSGTFASGPTFGWVPLAWGEPYWPHHRHSDNYWRLINRPYAVNVNRMSLKPLQSYTYANARIPGAVTAVSGEVFTGRRSIGGNHIAVPVTALSGAALTTSALAVRPMTRPPAFDATTRGAPAPASSFIGRGSLQRPEMRTPATDERFSGRPGVIAEPQAGGRPTYAPASANGAASGRPMAAVESPGFARPGAGSPPPNARQPLAEGQPMRPITREPAPNTAAPSSAPLQLPGQTYAPALRPTPPSRMSVPESAPLQQRPFAREPAPASAPQYIPTPREAQRIAPPAQPAPAPQQFLAPQYAPAPQQRAPLPPQYLPAPQHVPGPQQSAPPLQRAPPAPQYVPASNPPAPAPVPGQQGRPGIPNQAVPPQVQPSVPGVPTLPVQH